MKNIMLTPRERLKRMSKRIAIVCASIGALIVAGCLFFRISSRNDLLAYFEMVAGQHPIWKQFAFRRSNAGDSADTLIRRFPPNRREEFGRYGVYQYSKREIGGLWPLGIGLTVTARDGRLIRAESWSCVAQFKFFDVPDADFGKEYDAFIQQQIEERRRQKRVETNERSPNF
jgi:hypothetical protein